LALEKNSTLNDCHKSSIHRLVSGFLHLVADLIAIPAFCTHIEHVIKLRAEKTPSLLPESCNHSKFGHKQKRRDVSDSQHSSPEDLSEELVFNKAMVSEALQSSGHDISALMTPFMPRNVVDSSMTRSISDINAITVEVDSVNSSPGMPRRQPEEEITFESLRKIISEPMSAKQDELEIRRLQIVDRFKNSSFQDLINRYERKSNDLQQKLFETFANYSTSHTIESKTIDENDEEVDEKYDCVDSASVGVSVGVGGDEPNPPKEWHFYENPLKEMCTDSVVNSAGPPLFALKFPELFVY